MDPTTRRVLLSSSKKGDPVYVDDVFSTWLYTGNGSTNTITNGIDLAGEGGLVWIKRRDGTNSHLLYDTERGVNKYLGSNLTAAEYSAPNQLTAFEPNTGFSVGTESWINGTGNTFASWSFRKAPGFFDIVTYTGNGTAGREIAHSIGSTPGMVVVKRRDASLGKWSTWHRGSGDNQRLFLSDTSTVNANTNHVRTASGTTFTVGTDYDVNASGGTYVAYIFAHDDQSFGDAGNESIIKCGSYTGNGTSSSSINTITLGFEPQWVMIKRTDTTGDWAISDTMRGFTVVGVDDKFLYANSNYQETSPSFGGPTATGFQLEGSDGTTNQNSGTYIYIAIRRPHKPPSAGTEVFATATGNSSNPIPAFVSGFPVDAAFLFNFNGNYDNYLLSRLTGDTYLRTNTSETQVTGTGETFDSNTGWARIYNNTYQSVMFKRAPGFFDVVAYTGSGGTAAHKHNLTVAPELKIIKRRNATGSGLIDDWLVGGTVIPNAYMYLNLSSAKTSSSTYWSNGTDSATTFATKSGNYQSDHGSGNYIAYLFATLAGISKVGSYTGTGSALNVDCGFTNGARFVLIKRTDSSGDWYVWDTLRGIVSGNDPYLLLNVNTAQVTNTDYIDPLATGFTVTSSAPAALNTSGGTYIFLAIA